VEDREVDQRVGELYGLPLEQFVAARNALAKESKDPALRKLAKPSTTAWALNQLARTAPDEMDALLAAGRTVAETQAGAVRGRGSAPFRDAVQAERQALNPLLARARRLVRGEGQVQQVAEALRAAAADAEVGERLRAARLAEAPEPGGFGGLDGLEGLGAVASDESEDDSAGDEAEQEAEAHARAERQRPEREKAAGVAEREAARLDARAGEAEHQAVTLRARADEARQRADDARRAVDG
jgi:hypothetical protein